MDTGKIADNYFPRDPFIKTKMSDQMSRINLLKEMCIDKKLNVFMFCPKCLAVRIFNKIPFMVMTTGEEKLVYECVNCKKTFVEDAWNPDNSIEKLITINDLIAPYQTDMEIMEMKEEK